MRIPIQYAITYPDRAPSPAQFLSLEEYGALTFEQVDAGRFPCIDIAYRAGREGGTCPAAMNAANEEAVGAFLEKRIRLVDIPRVIEEVLQSRRETEGTDLESIIAAQQEARRLAAALLKEMEGET
jgi:1-deoxy-D-xylulose-5-phosphate reductoisomerase